MRFIDVMCNSFVKNKTVRIDDVKDINRACRDICWTLDSINGLGRYDTVLECYPITDYEVLDCMKSLIHPKAVTVAGPKFGDLLDRTVTYSDPNSTEERSILTPAEFKEAVVWLYSLMKITLSDSDFAHIKPEEHIIGSADEDILMVNSKVMKVGVGSDRPYPIPISDCGVCQVKYLTNPVDDQFIKDWITDCLINSKKTRK